MQYFHYEKTPITLQYSYRTTPFFLSRLNRKQSMKTKQMRPRGESNEDEGMYCILQSLHLTNDLARSGQGFHHLLTFLATTDGILAFTQEIVEFAGAVHVL